MNKHHCVIFYRAIGRREILFSDFGEARNCMSFVLLERSQESSRYETCFLSTVKLTAAGNELRTGSEVFVFSHIRDSHTLHPRLHVRVCVV